MSKKAEGFSLRFVLINTGNISRKVLSKVLRSFVKNFERLHYHMSGKIVVDSMMKYRKEGIGLGLSERGDYALWQTSEEEIVKAVKVLKTTG